jgi:hypothetical protein
MECRQPNRDIVSCGHDSYTSYESHYQVWNDYMADIRRGLLHGHGIRVLRARDEADRLLMRIEEKSISSSHT